MILMIEADFWIVIPVTSYLQKQRKAIEVTLASEKLEDYATYSKTCVARIIEGE